MTQIQKLTKDIFTHLQERGWDKPKPGPLAKSIIIEAAELLEHFQWSEHDVEKLQANPEKLEKIQSELADVMIYCLQLAKILGLDPEEIIRVKLKKVAEKYPAEKVLGNDAEYWKLKKESRKS